MRGSSSRPNRRSLSGLASIVLILLLSCSLVAVSALSPLGPYDPEEIEELAREKAVVLQASRQHQQLRGSQDASSAALSASELVIHRTKHSSKPRRAGIGGLDKRVKNDPEEAAERKKKQWLLKKKRPHVVRYSSTAGPVIPPRNISYWGGTVMTNPVQVYLIWYGSWPENQKQVLRNFVNSISDSSMANTPASVYQWWNLNRLYYNAKGFHVSDVVSLAGEASVPYSYGTGVDAQGNAAPLNDDTILNILHDQFNAGVIPRSENAFYAVLTAADVLFGGFCSGMCGYHSYDMYPNGKTYSFLKYAFIGSAYQCPSKCSKSISGNYLFPNGERPINGVVSAFAHELAESVTDPLMDAWFDGYGGENGDLCAWKWGNLYLRSNGPTSAPTQYNTIGSNGALFFVQNNLNIQTGQCSNGFGVLPGLCGPAYGGYPCPEGQCCVGAGTCTVCPPPPSPPPPSPPPPPPSPKVSVQASKKKKKISTVKKPPPPKPKLPPPPKSPPPPKPSPPPPSPSPPPSSQPPPPPSPPPPHPPGNLVSAHTPPPSLAPSPAPVHSPSPSSSPSPHSVPSLPPITALQPHAAPPSHSLSPTPHSASVPPHAFAPSPVASPPLPIVLAPTPLHPVVAQPPIVALVNA